MKRDTLIKTACVNFVAAAVLALAACATTEQNGPLATEANIAQGLETAATLGNSLYSAGKMSDSQAQATIAAFRAAQTALAAADAANANGDKTSAAVYLRAAADALDALMAQLAAIQKKG